MKFILLTNVVKDFVLTSRMIPSFFGVFIHLGYRFVPFPHTEACS